ncbi:hypothetical protein K458DRAFT_147782 [Lentithecium fluviatile CBS 122367]|uniref:Uncharacterized protein n=1 Tax=Lentithecium fluviatile CBS 122367 TaxID=1168545 RepID=A0A6G1JDA0_9PLEO|nr:hypothetical protein K458DRAFT_147782 [Lentithecium fluviatile CBS 122367]
MPCRVEFDGHNHWWFCCNCKDGPMNIFVTPSCTSCNDHCRCESGTFTVTPPKTPPHTDHAYHHPSNKGITSLDASKFQPADEPSPVSLVPDQGPDGHDQPSGATDGCISESVLDTQPDVQWNSLHEAIEQHTKTVVSLQSTLQQQLNLPAAPAIRSRPSGAQSKPRVQQGSSRRTSQNPSSRKQNQTNVRKVSKSWPGDQESDDDIHIQQPAAEDLPGPDPSLALQFACHFCKFDPHRHRNVKSCSRGYATASDLRQALTMMPIKLS